VAQGRLWEAGSPYQPLARWYRSPKRLGTDMPRAHRYRHREVQIPALSQQHLDMWYRDTPLAGPRADAPLAHRRLASDSRHWCTPSPPTPGRQHTPAYRYQGLLQRPDGVQAALCHLLRACSPTLHGPAKPSTGPPTGKDSLKALQQPRFRAFPELCQPLVSWHNTALRLRCASP